MAAAPLATVQHRGLAGLDLIAPALDDLYAATGTPVTARTRWQQAWAQTHPGWDPWIVSVASGDQLVASAALARARRGPLVRVVGLGHGTSDDARMPARDGAAAIALAGALQRALGELGRPWSLLVEQLPAECPVTASLVPRLPSARLSPGQGMPMVVVGARELGHYLSRNARQAETKARNRLAREGHTVTERWVRDPADVTAAIPRLAAVHRARDEQLGRVSDHTDQGRARFYEQVLTSHARAGEVEVLLLEIDGDLAAYVAAFRDGRALRVWDNRLSPAWAQMSAGRLANHTAIRHVVTGSDYDVLDWMRGEEPYKLSSATVVVPTQHVEAWSSRAARAPYAAKDALRRVRDRSPAFDRAVGRARAKAGQIRHAVDR